MTITITRLTTERVTLTRDEVITRLMEDEDFSQDGHAFPTVEEGRRLWEEHTDAELAELLAERLNEGDGHGRESLIEDIGERGTDEEYWTAEEVGR